MSWFISSDVDICTTASGIRRICSSYASYMVVGELYLMAIQSRVYSGGDGGIFEIQRIRGQKSHELTSRCGWLGWDHAHCMIRRIHPYASPVCHNAQNLTFCNTHHQGRNKTWRGELRVPNLVLRAQSAAQVGAGSELVMNWQSDDVMSCEHRAQRRSCCWISSRCQFRVWERGSGLSNRQLKCEYALKTHTTPPKAWGMCSQHTH
jgi:hypothetical protein